MHALSPIQPGINTQTQTHTHTHTRSQASRTQTQKQMDGEKQRAQPRRELQAGQSHMCRVVPTYGSQSIVRRLHAARQRGQSWSQRVPALTRLSLNFAPNREHERFINTVKPLFMDPSIISEPERHEEVSVSSASRSVCVCVWGGGIKREG